MTWNFDIATAPRDGSHVILAMPNGTTLRSYWCKPRHEPEHWCMLSHKNEPLAWMPWPEHPNLRDGADEILGGVAGSCSGIKCGENRTGTASETIGDSVERHAPHFILDDCGSGA